MKSLWTPLRHDGEGAIYEAQQEHPFLRVTQKHMVGWEERADDVVRAVNIHKALVDALDDVVRVADKRLHGRRPHPNDIEWVKDEIDKARAALALARGEQP